MSKNKPCANKPPEPQKSLTEKLKTRLMIAKAQRIIPLQEVVHARREVEKKNSLLRNPDELVKDGSDPVFALYASVQQLLSLCAEMLLQMPELKPFSKRLEKVECEYMPSYPPMSPITSSYFAMWTLCDLPIGSSSETLAQIFADLGTLFGLDQDYLELVRNLANSRMGIYEHCGHKDGKIVLRELITDKEILFVSNCGYDGNEGELWYVRAVPPPVSFISYWVGVVTPYVLCAPLKPDWLAFFERNNIRSGEVGHERRMYNFLKLGPQPLYWIQFIFEAYSGHEAGSLFLRGLPDVEASRPHSKSFDPLKGIVANS
jgi:hypothetical protein